MGGFHQGDLWSKIFTKVQRKPPDVDAVIFQLLQALFIISIGWFKSMETIK